MSHIQFSLVVILLPSLEGRDTQTPHSPHSPHMFLVNFYNMNTIWLILKHKFSTICFGHRLLSILAQGVSKYNMGLIFHGILILFSHVQFSFVKNLSYSACWTQNYFWTPPPISCNTFARV